MGTDISMRPGIFVDYRVLSEKRSDSGKCVGIVGCGSVGMDGIRAVSVTSLEVAYELFGETAPITALIGAVMDNADCPVVAVAVPLGAEIGQWNAALDCICALQEPYCIVCGSNNTDVLRYGTALLRNGSVGGKILFAPAPATSEAACAFATELNCERVVLCTPPLVRAGQATRSLASDESNLDASALDASSLDVSAAVVAAMAARGSGRNLFGEEVLGEYDILSGMTESEINLLLRGGVTVLEVGSVCPEVIRCVTTRTMDSSGKPDGSFRNLSAITALDEVVTSLRTALDARFEAGNGRLTLDMVRSVVELELLDNQELGLLSGYGKPMVELSEEDPSVCSITVELQIAQGVSQIRLLACIGI